MKQLKINFFILFSAFYFALSAQPEMYETFTPIDKDYAYFDDFSTNKNYEPIYWEYSVGTWSYNSYLLSSSDEKYFSILPINLSINSSKDFEIEIELNFKKSNYTEYGGIFFGTTRSNWNGFRLTLNENGLYSLIKKDSETSKTNFEKSLKENSLNNLTNKVTVRKVNQTFYFFLNEDPIGDCPFSSFSGDFFGLFSGAKSTIEFKKVHFAYLNTGNENYSKKTVAQTKQYPIRSEKSDFCYTEIPQGVQLVSNEEDWLRLSPIKACCCYPDFNSQNKSHGLLYNHKAYQLIKGNLQSEDLEMKVCSKENWNDITSNIHRDVNMTQTLQLNAYAGYFDQVWYLPENEIGGYWYDDHSMINFSNND
jgi:hypothetical protein